MLIRLSWQDEVDSGSEVANAVEVMFNDKQIEYSSAP